MLYADVGSALVTIGGSICAMLVGHGLPRFLGQIKWIRLVMRMPHGGRRGPSPGL